MGQRFPAVGEKVTNVQKWSFVVLSPETTGIRAFSDFSKAENSVFLMRNYKK